MPFSSSSSACFASRLLTPLLLTFLSHARTIITSLEQTTQAALGNEALREVAKRERERLRAVKRARAEELKRLKATEDQDFATDQVRRETRWRCLRGAC